MMYLLVFDIIMTFSMFFYLNEQVNVDVYLKNKETGKEIRPNEFGLNIIKIIMSVFWFITIWHIAYQKGKEKGWF